MDRSVSKARKSDLATLGLRVVAVSAVAVTAAVGQLWSDLLAVGVFGASSEQPLVLVNAGWGLGAFVLVIFAGWPSEARRTAYLAVFGATLQAAVGIALQSSIGLTLVWQNLVESAFKLVLVLVFVLLISLALRRAGQSKQPTFSLAVSSFATGACISTVLLGMSLWAATGLVALVVVPIVARHARSEWSWPHSGKVRLLTILLTAAVLGFIANLVLF